MSVATDSDTAWKRTAKRAVAASTTWAARSLYATHRRVGELRW